MDSTAIDKISPSSCIRVVPYSAILADTEEARNNEACVASRNATRYNTCMHLLDEIETQVPTTTTFEHRVPPWAPYRYTIWQPLIARSQQMSESHIFKIPSYLYEDLMKCHAHWIRYNALDEEQITEIAEMWESSKASSGICKLFEADSIKRWFFRLDRMSTKDSAFPDPSVQSLHDIIKRICTSHRGCDSLKHELATSGTMELILNPWDETIHAEFEYRCFVPPPAARGVENATAQDFRLTGIAQYRWFKPLSLPDGMSVEELANKVTEGAKAVLDDIVTYATKEIDPEVLQMLVTSGFVFDVFIRDGKRVELIELNPFGANGMILGRQQCLATIENCATGRYITVRAASEEQHITGNPTHSTESSAYRGK
ncbi:hypothetical protein BU24DRAFT_481867 [Aaosphaeria arxii CBS 175.79]|uniref:Cell division cycle protein 123 n=1 Tax=Aaosphaeria arxii CBS 175.79 TaxID=1450172 RepID=A0A6A5XMF4_9PLEO|nr:uncharacterized protein BU24DRAFT_481867 [Aaosphaeria arxii CBS 175.79]KAF2014425.1 hypothetical protein BU24DRAFT_481867 [Aaosphaeria arxii CBS 175.79]